MASAGAAIRRRWLVSLLIAGCATASSRPETPPDRFATLDSTGPGSGATVHTAPTLPGAGGVGTIQPRPPTVGADDDSIRPMPESPPAPRLAAPADEGRRERKHANAATVAEPPAPVTAPAKPADPPREDEVASKLQKAPEAAVVATPPAETYIAAPAMRAGRHDDNKEYNHFLSFLNENRGYTPYPIDVSERLVITTLDKNGQALPNCSIVVNTLDNRELTHSVTLADGRTQFFPADQSGSTERDYNVLAQCGSQSRVSQLSRTGRRGVDIRFSTPREVPAKVPVDIAIVIDTTGSMGTQIDRLKKTLKAIHFQLTQLSMKPDIRFGLVAYRDRGDEYITQVANFTNDVRLFQETLNTLEAAGGGDLPEDVQAGLQKAMHELKWRDNAVRVAFLIGDAPPHTDYNETFTYRDAMREGLARGIKVVGVAVGGADISVEAIWRQLSEFTMGEYVFVTESGGGDTGGSAVEASHHVGTNYQSENLDQAIVRIVRRELSYLTDQPKEVDDTIVATSTEPVAKDVVLGPAVDEALRQLVDYSSLRLKTATPVALVPVATTDAGYKDVAGYLSDRMLLAASRSPVFKVLERDLQAIAQEQKLQLSGLFDDDHGTVPFGNLIGAQVLIVMKLSVAAGEASLMAKLIRVETGEVLSVSRVDVGHTVLAGALPH